MQSSAKEELNQLENQIKKLKKKTPAITTIK